jgi:threonine/homoserine/homoserine lactone efflux protein
VIGLDPALLFAFWGLVFLLIVVPGPDWAYTLASGLRDRSVYPAVAGIVIGYLILTAVVVAGMGVLVADNAVVLTIITIGGAAYLIYLGTRLLARPSSLPTPDSADTLACADLTTSEAAGETQRDLEAAAPAPMVANAVAQTPWWTRVLRGIGVSALNPKGLLVFVALLPQFTDTESAWPVSVQIALLGLIFTVSCAVFYATLGLMARTILRTRPTVTGVVSRISGAAMVFVGLLLLAERILPLLTGRE